MADLIAEKPITFLEYLVVFPDVVHLAKTYKCSWSNWYLILGDGDRSTLRTLRMLRNESKSTDLSNTLQNLLTAESFRNKDTMPTEPLILLTAPTLTLIEYLKSMILTISILADRYRIMDTNKRGLYEHPFAICTGGTVALALST